MTDLIFKDIKGSVMALTITNNSIQKITTVTDGIPKYTTLEGLQFNMAGIVKEFPDLEGKPFDEMRRTALKRFKEHISKFTTESEMKEYIQKELKPSGYELIAIHKAGFRPQIIHNGKTD